MSVPSEVCSLSEVNMFIDGKRINTSVVDDDEVLFFVGFGSLFIGGTGFSALNQAEFPSWKPYIG